MDKNLRCHGSRNLDTGHSANTVSGRIDQQAGDRTGALYLVEQGKLSLDANINDYLKTWKVPDNEFTATQKVTLRRC